MSEQTRSAGKKSHDFFRLSVLGVDLSNLLGRRSPWEARVRWMVGPLIALAVVVATALGFDLAARPILTLAGLFFGATAVIYLVHRLVAKALGTGRHFDQAVLVVEVLIDYIALFFLIHLTGGVQSPLTLLLLFHVLLAAIQFSRRRAYLYASWAIIGLWTLLWLQALGQVESPPILRGGEPILFAEGVDSSAVRVIFLMIMIFLVAFFVGQIMQSLRLRVAEVASVTRKLSEANRKLSSLYVIVRAMGVERRLQGTLDLVVEQLATLEEDVAVGITLLEADGAFLRFAASHGLPKAFAETTRIDLASSPFHARVFHGETLVQGQIQHDPTNLLRSQFAAIDIRSVALAPMEIEGRVLGTLGLYAKQDDRFHKIDADFLRMAAELVAIAIEDARANEALDEAMRDRTRLMLQVAHNLRAPLGASLGLLELVTSDQANQLAPSSAEHLRRVVERLGSLDEMVGELMRIAQSRDWGSEIPDIVVEPGHLARMAEETFAAEARVKGVQFTVSQEDGLAAVDSGGDLLERVVENLVSNAIKYTPSGGEVEVRFERSTPEGLRLVVRDTGIGIPAKDRARLFEEFFRASNAKRLTASGTGLGLAFVKYAVERHQGRVRLKSEEGQGTVITVEIFAHRPRTGPRAPSRRDGSTVTVEGSNAGPASASDPANARDSANVRDSAKRS